MWMSRMFTSVEASDKGKLFFNDIDKDNNVEGGRCMF
jgi:hypothetical protein